MRSIKFEKRHIHIIIASAILVVLIAAYTIIDALFNSGAFNKDEGTGVGTVTHDASIGEAISGGRPAIYPYVSKESITKITVSSHKDDFIMQRPTEKDTGKYLSYFVFRYWDDVSKQYVDYLPDIFFSEENVDYESFYSNDNTAGLSVPKIEYLCALIGSFNFDSKVAISADKRDEQLKTYGLDADNREIVTVDYTDADGVARQHKIYIGDKLITGAGYYFMLDGRDMIYASAQSDRLDIVLGGFEKLVNSRVIAPSYATDGTYEPYLTTGYKQWSNTFFDKEGESVKDGSLVIFKTSRFVPDYENSNNSDAGGYIPSSFIAENMLNLGDIKSNYRYAYIHKALSGMRISKSEDQAREATVLTEFLPAELYDAEKNTGKYTYSITAIEAVYASDGSEISEADSPVLGASRVRVTYNLTLDGVAVNTKPYHAVIDLDTAKSIPQAAMDAIRQAKVGVLASPISYETRYVYDATSSANTNVKMRTVSCRIVSINQIYKVTGEGKNQKVEYLEEVDSDSIVYMSVCYVLTDEYGKAEAGETESFVIDLSKITEGDDLKIKNAILGMGVGVSDKSVELGRSFYQDMQSFEIYGIKNVVGFVEQDLEVAFKFVNPDDRDDFYGESTYANILYELDSKHKYAQYAMNVESCDRVVRILGGISSSSNSQSAMGLIGTETVAVGLTPEVMIDYDLYKGKTVSFGLPRGVDEDPIDGESFIWDHALTFNLYISPVQYDEDGNKFYYVGSEMYDIVVKLVSDDLDYLELSFPEFWARRNMVMISSSKLDMIELDFNMSDLYGSYDFKVNHKIKYLGSDGKIYNYKPEQIKSEEYDFITVVTTIEGFESDKSAVEGKYTETALSKYLVTTGKSSGNLGNLYSHMAGIPVGGEGLMLGHDSAGTGYYKEMLMVMFSTYYMGVLSDADMTKGAAKESLMKLSFTVDSSSSVNKYVYEFKRLDDRRIMVSFYIEDQSGARSEEVNDFYITDFAFKKIVSAYTSLLAGKAFDADTAYGY